MFALVRSLATQTLRHSSSPEQFGPAFIGRLDTLARLSSVLGADERRPVDLRRVIEAALEPYQAAGNLRLDGPPVALPPPVARSLSLVLHELATNAAKYGALSTEGGSVDLTWRRVAAGEGDPRLELDWREAGGPAIAAPPERRGFGCTLIEQSVVHGLGGSARLEFPPTGARCRLELPLPDAP
jgi:two-component sensor histidine kinase